MDGPRPLLDVQNLQTHLQAADGIVRAVDGVSLEIGTGESVALVGESGSGKSMTALSVMRLQPSAALPLQGQVRFQGRNLLGLPAAEMRRVRGRDITMIFQDPMTFLNPLMKAGRQVAEAVVLHQGETKAKARRLSIEAFERAGIPSPERVFEAYPHQLSGGMRQRVLISMAIVCRPSLLIADEPTTALDVTIQAQIMELLGELRREFGNAMLLITHDLGLVAEYCDRVYIMYAGQIVEHGSIFDIYSDPKHPYTRGLLRSILSHDEKVDEFEAIEGTVPSLIHPPAGCRFHTRCSEAMPHCAQDQPPTFALNGGRQVNCWLYR